MEKSNSFREELIQAITIVATTTNMTVNECIKAALKILEEEDRKYKRYRQEGYGNWRKTYQRCRIYLLESKKVIRWQYGSMKNIVNLQDY